MASNPIVAHRCIGVLLALWLSSAARAQEAAVAKDSGLPAAVRPRIGLVLSGGGARGSAHVGVLRVLEELRIPIDFVVGTSMGAIVGGLYAYGLSPAELEANLVRTGRPTDWRYLLSDGAGRQDLVFRRKEDERRFLTRLRVGVRDGGLAFPKGLLQGQNLEVELRSLTLGAHDLQSFDDLPLPFRCLAVDIDRGTDVVLDRGSLPDAMRASMSLPGIFAPVRIGGLELVDGGLLNNVPVDVARALGAEVLIVVDIGTPLEMDPEIRNLFDVTSQMVAILTEQNVRQSRQSLGPDDVLITPDLRDITSADFERAAESIAIGDLATRSLAVRLARFSVPATEYEAYLQRQRRRPAPPPRIRRLVIENESGLGRELIEARLGIALDQPLDLAALQVGIERLYGIDDLEKVSFLVVDRDGDLADLQVRVQEKSWGPSYLRLGLGLESDFDGDSTFNVSVQYNARVLDGLGSELRTRVQVGNQNLLESEYYRPLDVLGRWFVAPRIGGAALPGNLYQNGQKVAEIDMLYAALGLDVGLQLGAWGEMRVGLEGVVGELEPDLATVPLSRQDFDDALMRALLQVDTLDHPYLPLRGTLAAIEWRAGLTELGADQDYHRLGIRLAQAIPIGDRTALVPRVQVATALADTVPFYAEPTLGGFLKLSGYARDTFRDQHAGLLSLVLHHRMAGDHAPLSLPVYVGGSIEAGNAWSTRADFGGTYTIAGSAFLGLDTPLGPCFLAYGQAEGGVRSVYFFLGPWF